MGLYKHILKYRFIYFASYVVHIKRKIIRISRMITRRFSPPTQPSNLSTIGRRITFAQSARPSPPVPLPLDHFLQYYLCNNAYCKKVKMKKKPCNVTSCFKNVKIFKDVDIFNTGWKSKNVQKFKKC